MIQQAQKSEHPTKPTNISNSNCLDTSLNNRKKEPITFLEREQNLVKPHVHWWGLDNIIWQLPQTTTILEYWLNTVILHKHKNRTHQMQQNQVEE